jgi:hypothetical protein
MRTGLIVASVVAVTLTACGVESAVIRSQAISYDDIIEDTTDKLLLLNILRAKDKAPLHFDEIPSIHESIQATASVQASWPFGPRLANTNQSPRNMVQPTVGVQVTPTFEVDHLDTQDFVTGIASPIDPKFVKYWLDRGLDRRLVLLMFFSAVTITETDNDGGRTATTSIRLTNSPRDAIDTLSQQLAVLNEGSVSDELRCDTHSDFQHYLKLIDSLQPFVAQYFKEPRLLVEKLSSDVQVDKSSEKPKEANWQVIAALDPDKFQWVRNGDGTFNVYALPSEPKTTLCPVTGDSKQQDRAGDCIQLGVSKNPDELTAPKQYPLPSPPVARRAQPTPYCALFNGLMAGGVTQDAYHPTAKVEVRFEIRSVGEMIQFLGDLLEYQDELARTRIGLAEQLRLHDPVTFGYCADEPRGLSRFGCDDVFFNLPSDTCNTRFSVNYRGRIYSVPNYNSPVDDSCQTAGGRLSAQTRDHTLEVLSVVHQMVDLQKSAQDIRETPYVQVLP